MEISINASTTDMAANLLSGSTLGLVGAMLIAVWRAKGGTAFRGVAVLFGAGVAIYALALGPPGRLIGSVIWLRTATGIFLCGTIGYYSLLIDTVFLDRQPGWRGWLPTLSMICVGGAVLNSSGMVRGLLLAVYVFVAMALPIRASAILLRGWAGDLDENRRRLRYPIVAASLVVAVAIVLDVVAATATRLGLIHGWHNFERQIVIGLLTALVTWLVFDGRTLTRPRDRERIDNEDVRLQAILQVMTEKQAWQREGLTLGLLAKDAGVPEHVVRRLILQRLGHRNFPAFVNAYRIEAACRRLVQPDAADNVASVAFDVGFSSLSAFNRAFRDATGETPTRWRQKHVHGLGS